MGNPNAEFNDFKEQHNDPLAQLEYLVKVLGTSTLKEVLDQMEPSLADQLSAVRRKLNTLNAVVTNIGPADVHWSTDGSGAIEEMFTKAYFAISTAHEVGEVQKSSRELNKFSSYLDGLIRTHDTKYIQIYAPLMEFAVPGITQIKDSMISEGEALKSDVANAAGAAAESAKQAGNSQKQVDKDKNEINELFKKAIYSESSHYFSKQAKGFRIAQWVWLGVIAVGIAVAVYVSWWLLKSILDSKRNGHELHAVYSLAKLAILSFFFYGLAIANKTYRACRHGYSTNMHLSNAISTLMLLRDRIVIDTEKDALIAKATELITQPLQTGELPRSSERPPTIDILVDALKKKAGGGG